MCKRYPLTPPHYLCLLTIPRLSRQWSTSGWGVTHISLPTQEYDRGRQEKTKQTNKHEQSLGLTKGRGRYCNTICMCGLSLAWVTSENSTMLLESDSSWLTLAGPYPMLPRLSAPVSGVDRPCPFFHANCPLCSPAANSPLCSPAANCILCSPAPTALSASRHQLSFASPYHFRIRRDFMSKNPLSGFAPKQTRLLWRPTPIVLHLNYSALSSGVQTLGTVYARAQRIWQSQLS